MEQKVITLTLACFALSLLLVFDFYTKPVEAQLAFTVTPLTSYSGVTNDQSNCEYITSSEVWCGSTSGVKIINPTTRTITNTLYSGITIQDVECALFCYSWHNGGTPTGNLTQWSISSKTKINSTTFSISGGGNIGREMDAFTLQGAENLLIGASSGCNTSSTSTKGLCIFDGISFTNARFISSGDTGNSAVTFNMKFSGTTAPFTATAVIFFQDGAGTRTMRILNLADADTTYATTQVCSGSATGFGATDNIEIFIYDENWYIPFDNGATGLYLELPIDSVTCATVSRFVTTWDIPTSLSTDGEFWYVGSYDGATSKSAMQVFNLTGSVSIATYNITNTSGAGEKAWNGWYHSTEGELQILRGSNLVVFQVQAGSGSGGGNNVNGRCGVGTVLDCVGDRSLSTAITGGEDITVVAGNLFCGIGLNATCSGTTQENGTGLLLMLITGTFFTVVILGTIATANTRFGAGISYTEIPKELWLFLVVGVVAFSWYMGWIPDIVFYGMILGLVGLFSFGLYRHIRG